MKLSAKKIINTTIALPSSKSESNRVLLIDALYHQQTGKKLDLHNLSTARDTVTMQRLLASKDLELNVIDAGTTMRFLTAFCAVTNREAILTGTERMCERPIGILVEALRTLGSEIDYTRIDGFPPLHINKFSQKTNKVLIRGDVSSQYISALLMIAPLLPQGLTLELLGEIQSQPYIEMTIDLMQHFGIEAVWRHHQIHVYPQTYQEASYSVESDWSAASYWYSMAALADEAEILLLGLKEKSLQGDKAIVDIAKYFGVESEFTDKGVILKKTIAEEIPNNIIDFSDCPDLAQTIAVIAAAQGKELTMKGLQSLRIKETDRISAIQHELHKFGIEAFVQHDTDLYIRPQTLHKPNKSIATYKDHRMAMAFAPLALHFDIEIQEPEVVAKSYPHFWEDMAKVFKVQ
jgi:3-phosphoshikimate 1-carboxyvinyltransferase